MPVRQSEVFTSTSLPCMGSFSRTFKALNAQMRTSPGHLLPLILSILDDMTVAQELISLAAIPKDTIESIRREINGLEREVKGVGAVGVGDVVEDVRRRGQSITTLPSDAGIIDLTNDVLAYP